MIRVGNQLGKKDYTELRRIALSIFLLSLLFAIGFATLFLLLHDYLPTFYLDLKDAKNALDNTEVLQIASQLMFVAALFQISDSMQVICLGALRGLQDVKIPTMITLLAYWLVGFPISYYFGLYTHLGSMGIWYGLLAGLTVAAIFLYLRFHYSTKKLIRENSITT